MTHPCEQCKYFEEGHINVDLWNYREMYVWIPICKKVYPQVALNKCEDFKMK